MPTPKCTDEEFRALWFKTHGSPARMSEILNVSVRSIYSRRRSLELQHGALEAGLAKPAYDYQPRMHIEGFTGTLISFSDCHWWPGLSETIAFKALLEVLKEIKPEIVVGNGDLLDGADISRFRRKGWDRTPRLKDEVEEVKLRCSDIRTVHRRARHIRTIGNHDERFDSALANASPQFEDVAGTRLSDHLKEWEETKSLWINGHTVIKHNWHGGIHAAYNNVMRSGVTMITGHTHELEVKPYADYKGRRYACQDGTLADPYGPQFAYAEDNPTRACAGFVVVNFDKAGRVLQPELCEVIDGVAWFRGQKVVRERKRAA